MKAYFDFDCNEWNDTAIQAIFYIQTTTEMKEHLERQ